MISCSQVLTTAKECGGNAKAVNAHQQLDEATQGLKEVCEDLVRCLDELASRQGHVNTMIDTLTKAVAKVIKGGLSRMLLQS